MLIRCLFRTLVHTLYIMIIKLTNNDLHHKLSNAVDPLKNTY